MLLTTLNMKAVKEQLDPHPDWATYILTVKRKAATYQVASETLVEYEKDNDVPTKSESTENLGKGKRRKSSPRRPYLGKLTPGGVPDGSIGGVIGI